MSRGINSITNKLDIPITIDTNPGLIIGNIYELEQFIAQIRTKGADDDTVIVIEVINHKKDEDSFGFINGRYEKEYENDELPIIYPALILTVELNKG